MTYCLRSAVRYWAGDDAYTRTQWPGLYTVCDLFATPIFILPKPWLAASWRARGFAGPQTLAISSRCSRTRTIVPLSDRPPHPMQAGEIETLLNGSDDDSGMRQRIVRAQFLSVHAHGRHGRTCSSETSISTCRSCFRLPDQWLAVCGCFMVYPARARFIYAPPIGAPVLQIPVSTNNGKPVRDRCPCNYDGRTGMNTPKTSPVSM